MNRISTMQISRHHAERGFTLIELMVTVLIIAIIAAIAIPSYRSHITRANRADAESYMMQVASMQEQILLDSRAYVQILPANNSSFGRLAPIGVGLAVPDDVAHNYTLSISAPAPAAGQPPTYQIIAVPTAAQVDTACQTLTLDQSGQKGVTNGATSTWQACWQ